MKVILLEDVKKLGKKDDIVEVSDGFANNVLFKKNQAIEFSKGNDKKLKKQINERNEELAKLKEHNLKIKKELEKLELKFKLNGGKNGSIFGSISSKQIVEALKEKGYDLKKTQVHMQPINHFGYDKVQIELQKDVIAEIKVLVEEK